MVSQLYFAKESVHRIRLILSQKEKESYY